MSPRQSDLHFSQPHSPVSDAGRSYSRHLQARYTFGLEELAEFRSQILPNTATDDVEDRASADNSPEPDLGGAQAIALNTAPDVLSLRLKASIRVGATADLFATQRTYDAMETDRRLGVRGGPVTGILHPDVSFREGITNRVHWTPLPWPNPNGMEFQFLFAREPSAKFATNELIHLKGLPIPKKNEVFESDFTTNVMSIDVEFIGLAGALAEFDFRPKIPSAGLSLQVEASSPSWITRIDVVSVQDEQGDDSRRACVPPQQSATSISH